MNSKEESELRDNFIFANTAQFLYLFHETLELEAIPPFVFFFLNPSPLTSIIVGAGRNLERGGRRA